MIDLVDTARFHGNGFIQVVLNPVTRMHIYDPDFEFKRVKNARIHDHAFDFTSQVLVGELLNERYDVWAPGAGHGLYKVDKQQEGEPLVRICGCGMDHVFTDVIKAGYSYKHSGPRNFHDTLAHEFTVTVMTKTGYHPDYSPRIVALDDAPEPDDAFGTQPLPNQMRASIQKAFRMLA